MTRLITTAELEEHFTMAACLDALETMFGEMGAGRAITDSREDILTPVRDPPDGSVEPVYHGLKSMGGSIPGLGVGAVRINSDVINWPTHGGKMVRQKIPAAPGERYTGLVLLFSTNTGEPLAIFPDGYVQSHRVAGTSALGAKYLARGDSSRLGILGAGQQARAHLEAYDVLFDLDAVRVFSPTPASREAYADEMGDALGLDVRAVDGPEAAFDGADVVQTATNSGEPVFERDWIEPGTHVGVIRSQEPPEGFFDPDAFDAMAQSWSPITQLEQLGDQLNERAIPTKNVNNYLVTGERPPPKFSTLDAGGEPMCDWSAVPGLGEVVAGEAAGRTDPDGVTFFYNSGMGIQFAAVGRAILDVAEEEDLGRDLSTELFTQEYHP